MCWSAARTCRTSSTCPRWRSSTRRSESGVGRRARSHPKRLNRFSRGYSTMATEAKPKKATQGEGRQTLAGQGLAPSGNVHWNLVQTVLLEAAVRRGEGEL